MSDRTNPASPASIQERGAPDVPDTLLQRLVPRQLADLALGFYCVFWGTLATLAGAVELLVTVAPAVDLARVPAPRLFPVVVCIGGAVAILVGSWRLYRAGEMGNHWRRTSRRLLIAAVALAYLMPVFFLWRRAPSSLYLLGHALAFLGMLICFMGLLCLVVAGLARASGQRSLATQASLFGAGSFLVLVLLSAVVTQAIIVATRRGLSLLEVLQFLLNRVPPAILLALLLPLSLTLSAVWAAKDVVHRELRDRV